MKLLILITLLFAVIRHSFAADCIAHRGFTSASIENTLEAIREAWVFEADAVEVDIHVSRDGQLFLFHDDDVAGKLVKSLDYAELQSVVASYHVPTLQEALTEVPSGKAIVLDLKSNSMELYEALADLLSKESFDFQVIIQSPSLAFLSDLKLKLPENFSYHYLTKLERSGLLMKEPSAKELIAQLKGSGISGISVKGRQFIDRAFVDRVKSEGIRIYVWTINDPVRIRHYTQLGADGIITDHVEARKHIEEGKADDAG